MQVFHWPCFLLHMYLRLPRSFQKSMDWLINEHVNVKHLGLTNQKLLHAHSQLLRGQYPLSSSI